MLTSLTRIADSISIQALAKLVGAELEPGISLEITGVAPLDEAGPTELGFVGNPTYASRAPDSMAGALLVDTKFRFEVPMPILRVPNPRLAYAQALEALFAPARPAGGIHPTAIVPDTCEIDPSASIGAYVVLGAHVRIGPGTIVHPHVVVYDAAVIGADCVLHSGAVVREGVTLGDRNTLQNGAIIGADGFGYAPTAERRWHKVPQAGTVTLGDDVEVQASACIDRAAVGRTSIGRGTKIDSLVQVGHGCRVGEDTLLCGQVGLAGSTTVGSRSMIGGQVGSTGHITIGDDVTVGGKSGVMGDLEAGKSYAGNPAMELRRARLVYLQFTKLPEIAKRLKALERAQQAAQEG